MDMPNSNIITVHDAATGETIVRDMNDIELEVQSEIIAGMKAQEKAKADKAATRASAIAKLADLGLTPDEIAALVGA
jgi:hypothetical protein